MQKIFIFAIIMLYFDFSGITMYIVCNIKNTMMTVRLSSESRPCTNDQMVFFYMNIVLQTWGDFALFSFFLSCFSIFREMYLFHLSNIMWRTFENTQIVIWKTSHFDEMLNFSSRFTLDIRVVTAIDAVVLLAIWLKQTNI